MTEPLTPKYLLENAAEWLEKHEWTRGIFADASGCRCMVGAVLEPYTPVPSRVRTFSSAVGLPPAVRALTALYRVLDTRDDGQPESYDDLQEVLFIYNDNYAKSKEEVIATLRKAAALCN